MFVKVLELKEQGFRIAFIAKKLGISRNTVYKYLNMSLEEALDWINSLNNRRKKLDPYRDRIVNWLKDHPDLSSASNRSLGWS